MCSKNIISAEEEYANQRAGDHKRLMSAQREGREIKKHSRKEKPQSDVN